MVINSASVENSDVLTIIRSCDMSIHDTTINNGAASADGCTTVVINDKTSIDMDVSLLIDDNSYGVIYSCAFDIIKSITVEFNGLLLKIVDTIDVT